MNGNDAVFFFLYFAALFLLTPLLGTYIARVMEGNLPRFLKPISNLENFFYKITRTEAGKNSDFKGYVFDILAFTFIGLSVVTFGLHFQNFLPGNPEGKPAVPWDLAWNTAVSFVTNTNWQAYSGEVSFSYSS